MKATGGTLFKRHISALEPPWRYIISPPFTQNTRTADARRLDINNGLLQATFLVDCKDDQQLFAVIDKLKTKIPEASITFVDQRNSLAE